MHAEFRVFFASAAAYITSRNPLELLAKGYRLWRREGMAGLKRIYLDMVGIGYSQWIKRHDTLVTQDRRQICRHIKALIYKPKISVLMPVFNPPPEFLQSAIVSVRNQLYPNWELCIADNASTNPLVRSILEEVSRDDPRIKVVFRNAKGQMSAATNSALDLACGEFIALLDHDDELAEHALYHVAIALNENRILDLIYSDEDKIDGDGIRFAHNCKPDWNPDLFLAQNVICRLSVYRRTLACAIGGLREGYEGFQDWDFALRFVDAGVTADHIRHLPRILYHCRSMPAAAVRGDEAEKYAIDSGRRALLDYWERRDVSVSVIPTEGGHFTTQFPLRADPPLVSIIICTRNREDLLRQCLEGLAACNDYSKVEILIVDNGSDDPGALHYLFDLHESGRAEVLRHPAPFNFPELNNLAVRHASGELLCLMNNDIVPKSSHWLTEMVANALRSDIGAVGAKLYYPNGTVQHAGVVLNGVAAGHLHLGYPGAAAGYGNRARLAQNFSAVTAACLVIRKALWDEVGGMDEAFGVAFNDVDFCLRVQKLGYRNLWLPQAELYHHESASRGAEDTPEKQRRFAAEVALLQQRWGKLIANDPAWNPNLAYNGARIGLASPPRIDNPWSKIAD